MTKVVVTGIGIISSIGNNLEETYNSLIQKKSGISKINILETVRNDEFLLGEINLTQKQLIELAEVDANLAWTRTALLGVIAAKQAIKDSNIEPSNNMALVSASTVGGMDRSELFYKDFLGKAKHKNHIDTHHAGNSTEMIADICGINGLITTISTACSSSLNSIMFGSRLIKNGKTKSAIVGGTDALSKFTLNGFNTLMILDKDRCRPFDESRRGLNLGEGAAYLVLEEEESAKAAGKKIYAEVRGYANANDAHHQTASSENGEGPFLAMKNALKEAELEASQINYINAHGTGTENNDLTESIAIKRLFGENHPPFSSTKAFTGHTLGAAGVIESVFSILALNNKVAFPSMNFISQGEGIEVKPITELINLENANHVITNSFGFGGNDSSVIFSAENNSEKSSKIKNSKSIFINGMGCVSPQNTLGNTGLYSEIIETESKYLTIQKPNYRDFINPKLLRRMSKIVKMGIVASKTALENSQLEKPDAIITSTGMGCQVDTEKFLNSMIENNEGLLTPTSFIQSTHNTVGGAIALGQQNHNYNLTYVHRTFSFETALLDSLLLINESKAKNILLGGFDEITEESWLIKTKINFYKTEPTKNLNLLNDKQQGALAGEGSSFFVLSDEKDKNTKAEVLAVEMFYKPKSEKDIQIKISEFLNENSLTSDDIDLVILGLNGDCKFDEIYKNLESELFANNTTAFYKHLCGEYDTSSAFATYLAAEIIHEQKIPEVIIRKGSVKNKIDKVLIYNHFRNINHSLILLGK
jgi:3-oxoacyl-(acyl-carrier-protein) synthase